MVHGRMTRKQGKQRQNGQAGFRPIAPRPDMEQNDINETAMRIVEEGPSDDTNRTRSQAIDQGLARLDFQIPHNVASLDQDLLLDPALQNDSFDGMHNGDFRSVLGNQQSTLPQELHQLGEAHVQRQEQAPVGTAGPSTQDLIHGEQNNSPWNLGVGNSAGVPDPGTGATLDPSQLQNLANNAMNMDTFNSPWMQPTQPGSGPSPAGPSTATSHYQDSAISSYEGASSFPDGTSGTSMTGCQYQQSTTSEPSISLKRLDCLVAIAIGPPYECPYCDFVATETPSQLKKHFNIHIKDELPFWCEVCVKPFSEKKERARHMVTHTGAKPCQCSQCPSRFGRKDHLKRHKDKFHKVGTASNRS